MTASPPEMQPHNEDVQPMDPSEKSSDATQLPQPNSPPSNKRSRLLYFFTFLLLLTGLGWFLFWYFYLQYHAKTDDAYSNGNIVNINSAVSGSVIAFYADDTDLVMEGQLLVELDPTNFQFAYQKSLANLAAQALQVREYYDDVQANQANVDIRKTMLSKARFDFENRTRLIDAKAISNEDFIHSREDLTIAENELKKAELQLKVAQDKLGTAPLENHPLLEEKKAEVRLAYYNLKRTKIYAPLTGYVAKRSVNVGESATPAVDLMAIIPTDYVWVDANYKETELTYMRIGQPAIVWFDLYGSSVKYQGKVLGIASGSGSIFSLIPPQNATGNWIKIVQRLPVRISLDPETVKKYPVRLGISAEVDVDLTDQDLPMLTQVPPSKPVAVTDVFDLYLKEVNQIINEVIKMNLNLSNTAPS